MKTSLVPGTWMAVSLDMKPKPSSFILLMFVLFSSPLWAFEHWNIPIENELKTLWVSNVTSQAQVLQLGNSAIQIPAYGRSEIPLNEFKEDAWLKVRALQEKLFSLRLSTRYEDQFNLISGQSTRWKVRVRPQSDLIVFNLAPFEQSILIESLGKPSQQIPLKAFEKKRISLVSGEGSLLTLSGAARFSGILISPYGSRSWVPDPTPVKMPEVLTAPESYHYFRVSTSSNTQSYVVALSDPNQVEQARNQVAHPLTALRPSFAPRILVARIAYGSGGFNRDLSSKAKVPWSWHVEKVLRFAELASQDCNGSPEELEENLKAVVESSGVICFWNYRIVEELSRDQLVPSSLL
jgi:hypothetical protein